jgi:nitroreductase/NAD-dependent dihydropyrimidine dehydrogenase PreA subunit
MNLLTINKENCSGCGVCVQSCPVSVIAQGEAKFPFVPDANEERCVFCGHCEAICPNDALKHNRLPEMVSIRQERLKEITPDNIAEYFRSRRSIRTYQSKPVEKAILEEVLNIINYSPTGVNFQKNQWIVINDKKKIRQLAEEVIGWMRLLVESGNNMALRLGCQNLIASFDQGKDVICRNAPVLIIGYTETAYGGGANDSVIATSHLELLLPAFGLGGCWAGYLMIALQFVPDLKKMIGLNDSYTVRTVLMAGYPKYRYFKIPYRKAPQVRWIG